MRIAAVSVLDLHPEITTWVVGGHSLGGTTAATLADRDERVKGLALFASYPADNVVRTDLEAVSISGTADGFATPEDIEASKGKLPPNTSYVVINGAVHSSFGDYGDQSGDGTATIARIRCAERDHQGDPDVTGLIGSSSSASTTEEEVVGGDGTPQPGESALPRILV